MTKEKYMIALDMDGTLLNSKGKITENTLTVLKSLMEAGHDIVPASGRAFPVLPEELKQLEGIRYAVLENGAVIWDWKRQRPVCTDRLPEGTAQEILSHVKTEYPDTRYYTEVMADGIVWAEEADVPFYESAGVDGNFAEYMMKDHVFARGLHNRSDILQKAEKLNLYFEDPEKSATLRARWESRQDVCVTTSVSGNAEFTASDVNKGRGLEKLCKRLGFRREYVVAVGDNENDMEMLEFAGNSAAMGNASKTVKMVARCVTEDNDHDGAAVFLKETFAL